MSIIDQFYKFIDLISSNDFSTGQLNELLEPIIPDTISDYLKYDISNGAIVILSGGQGSRLGFDGPKGMFDFGLGKSIFQLHIENIINICQVQKIKQVPIYIMTSDLNHEVIKEFFQKHDYFGYNNSIFFFQQSSQLCFDDTGNIIQSNFKPVLLPDGNGSIYESLKNSGAYEDFKERGITYLHIYSIDNILTKPLDPKFITFCKMNNVDLGSKCVLKANENEKVGTFFQINNQCHVLEYTSKINNGIAANICNHYISVSFYEKIIKYLESSSMKYHFVKKKITVNNDNIDIWKAESFIFDFFPLTDKWIVVEVDRNNEFAPIKNAVGEDSPTTALKLYNNLMKK